MVEASCFRPTSRPPPALHLVGRGLKPKKSTPLVFFFYFFFFSKRSYFLQWFYTEGKHKQKKKKIIYVNLPLLFPASRKLFICLKTKEGFFQKPRERDACTEPTFCCSALPAARTPGTP